MIQFRMVQLQMVHRHRKGLVFYRFQFTCVMSRQDERGADCPEYPVIDGRHFRHLDRLQRRMDDGTAQRFIVCRTARWCGNA